MNIKKKILKNHAHYTCCNHNFDLIKSLDVLQSHIVLSHHKNMFLVNARFISQIYNTFLIYETSNYLIFVDQHAAHEQILFENNFKTYKLDIENHNYISICAKISITSVKRLYPIILRNKRLLKKIGFNFIIKKNNILIYDVISFLSKYSFKDFIYLFEDEIDSELNYDDIIVNIIKTISQLQACHRSIRSGDTITAESAEVLKNQLNNISNNNFCPHGRPLMLVIELSNLLKHFYRQTISTVKKGLK